MAIKNVGLIRSTTANPSTRASALTGTPSSALGTPTLCWQVTKVANTNYTMSLSITPVVRGEEVWSETVSAWGTRNVTSAKVEGGVWCRVSLATLISAFGIDTKLNAAGLPAPVWPWADRTYDALKITFVVKATAYPATRVSKELAIRYAPTVASAVMGATEGGRYRLKATLADGWEQAGSAFRLVSCAGHACSAVLEGTEDGTAADLTLAADALAYGPDLDKASNAITLEAAPWYGGSAATALSASAPEGEGQVEPVASAARSDDGSVTVIVEPDAGIESYLIELIGGGLDGDAASGAAGEYTFRRAPMDAHTWRVTGFSLSEDGFLAGSSVEVEADPSPVDGIQLIAPDGTLTTLLYDVSWPYSSTRDSASEQLAGRTRPSVWFGEGGTGEWSLEWSVPPDGYGPPWLPSQGEQVERALALAGVRSLLLLPDGSRRQVTADAVSVKRAEGRVAQLSATFAEVG